MLQIGKNEKLNLTITDLGSSGEGIGKVDGYTVFVPGALPGEQVEAQTVLVKKSYAVASLRKIFLISPERVQPPCLVFNACGGCQLQHLSYQGQLKYKKMRIWEVLKRIAHLPNPVVLEALAAENPWHYRNKMLFAASGTGLVEIGCYAKASHQVVNVPTCLIQKQANNEILHIVRTWMQDYNIPAYEEKTKKGLVRNVLGRVSVKTGQIMVGLVTAQQVVPFLPKLVALLKENISNLKSVVQIIKTDSNNVMLSGEEKVLYGVDKIVEELNCLHFKVSAKSFFQVNSRQAEKLYAKALEFAELKGWETVVEAYSGTGTIGMIFAKYAKRVYGLELSAAAVKDAKENAILNKAKNIEFIQGDVAETLPKLLKSGIAVDLIVVDPPRAGLSPVVLQSILASKVEKLIYISCNPASFARDVQLLSSFYDLEFVQPVDMFPMTFHIELVAKFRKKF